MALRQGDWKLVRYDAAADDHPELGATPHKLYNLRDDIGEATDVAAAQPERLKKMLSAWEDWNAQLVAPLWGQGRRSGGD